MIAGIPFGEVAAVRPLLWIVGGIMAFWAISMFVKEKWDEFIVFHNLRVECRDNEELFEDADKN